MDPPLYIIDPRVWSCLTFSHTSLCAPQGHISEQLSCCDPQEHFQQHLFCLQPHITRYVMNVMNVGARGISVVINREQSPSLFQPLSVGGEHLVLIPHHSLEMCTSDGLMYKAPRVGGNF